MRNKFSGHGFSGFGYLASFRLPSKMAKFSFQTIVMVKT